MAWLRSVLVDGRIQEKRRAKQRARQRRLARVQRRRQRELEAEGGGASTWADDEGGTSSGADDTATMQDGETVTSYDGTPPVSSRSGAGAGAGAGAGVSGQGPLHGLSASMQHEVDALLNDQGLPSKQGGSGVAATAEDEVAAREIAEASQRADWFAAIKVDTAPDPSSAGVDFGDGDEEAGSSA